MIFPLFLEVPASGVRVDSRVVFPGAICTCLFLRAISSFWVSVSCISAARTAGSISFSFRIFSDGRLGLELLIESRLRVLRGPTLIHGFGLGLAERVASILLIIPGQVGRRRISEMKKK